MLILGRIFCGKPASTFPENALDRISSIARVSDRLPAMCACAPLSLQEAFEKIAVARLHARAQSADVHITYLENGSPRRGPFLQQRTHLGIGRLALRGKPGLVLIQAALDAPTAEFHRLAVLLDVVAAARCQPIYRFGVADRLRQ